MIIFLWVVSACTTDFENINENPNSPTVDKAAPDQLLTNAIEAMVDRVHEIFLGHEMGSCWAQHMAKCQYTDEDRYIYRPDVVTASWTSFYATSGQDIDLVRKLGASTGNPNYEAIGKVLRVYVGSVLTDLFGEVPYSQAWKGDQSIISPSYDTQEDIYALMIEELDEANTLFQTSGFAVKGDILYKGDITKWKKFANSLRLRLLLRQSGPNPGDATAKMTAMLAAPATYPIFEDNEDNAALVYLGSSPNNNPINENRKTRDDHRVSENLIDLLINNGDYRVMVYAKPSAGTDEFVGMRNGLTSVDAAAFNGNGLSNTSKIGDYFSAATAPGMLMSYAELEFILAEAAKKGYIPGGEAAAQAHYEAGMKGSFEQFRAPLQAIFDEHAGDEYGQFAIPNGFTVDEAYEEALAASPYVAGSGLQLIATQRYLATFDQGLQTWFEWRRTGYPVLTPATSGTNGGFIPVRIPYPLGEATLNKAAMDAAIARQGADDLNTKVWWDNN